MTESIGEQGRTCESNGCERRSVLPVPYTAACSKHYIMSVDAAQAAARESFRMDIRAKLAAKGIDPAEVGF
jgi:hypothetical protein